MLFRFLYWHYQLSRATFIGLAQGRVAAQVELIGVFAVAHAYFLPNFPKQLVGALNLSARGMLSRVFQALGKIEALVRHQIS